MATTVEHRADLGVVVATHTGHVALDELVSSGEKGFALAREAGTWLFVSDCSAMVSAPSIVDQLALAEYLQAEGVTGVYRQSIIRPTEHAAAVTVAEWETVAVNRGVAVRVVDDLEGALRWLGVG